MQSTAMHLSTAAARLSLPVHTVAVAGTAAAAVHVQVTIACHVTHAFNQPRRSYSHAASTATAAAAAATACNISVRRSQQLQQQQQQWLLKPTLFVDWCSLTGAVFLPQNRPDVLHNLSIICS
jgi:hypothetical protein